MKEARSFFRDSSIWADNNGNDTGELDAHAK